MLGITDCRQFWIAFWSSLFAGAIDSLIFGLVVGVMILIFQWKVDARKVRHACEQDVATFQEQLWFVLNQASTTYVDNLLQPSSLVTAIAKLLSESPLTLWKDKVKRQKKFLNKVKEYQRMYSTFVLIASKLNSSVILSVRKINSRQGVMRENDKMLLTYFTGKMLGAEAEDILPWIGLGGMGSPQTIASYEANYKTLLEDEEVKAFAPQYKDAWQKLEKAIDMLRDTLNDEPHPHEIRIV